MDKKRVILQVLCTKGHYIFDEIPMPDSIDAGSWRCPACKAKALYYNIALDERGMIGVKVFDDKVFPPLYQPKWEDVYSGHPITV